LFLIGFIGVIAKRGFSVGAVAASFAFALRYAAASRHPGDATKLSAFTFQFFRFANQSNSSVFETPCLGVTTILSPYKNVTKELVMLKTANVCHFT